MKNILKLAAISFLWAHGASAQSTQAPSTTTEVYDQWTVACVRQDGGKLCETRTGVHDDKGALVVQISFGIRGQEEKTPIMQIAVPHMVDLKSPIGLSVDGAATINMEYAFCNPNACMVADPVNEDTLWAFQSGDEVVLNIQSLAVGTIEARASLKGFTASYKRLLQNHK